MLHVFFLFQGCAVFEYFDGSSKKEIQKNKMTKDEMWDEMEKLKTENQKLQTQINILKKENQRRKGETENKTAMMNDQIEPLNEQLNKLKKENQRLTAENRVLSEKSTSLQSKDGTPLSKSYELKKDKPKLKMKVLSGDGDLTSAKEMAKKLRNMGYEIECIHPASRSDFTHTIVYYKPECQDEAKRLVLGLGGNTILKPLTWPSAFDIMVVTGKNP
jgi:seryl-tRNA synthetase